jgi:hypothetical protein
MAGARHGELVVGEFQAEADHGVRLHRLQTRTWVDDEIRVADAGEHGSVRPDRNSSPVVHRLLQAAPGRHGDGRDPTVEPCHVGPGGVVAPPGGAVGSPAERADRGAGTAVR